MARVGRPHYCSTGLAHSWIGLVCCLHVPRTVFTAVSALHCRRPPPGLAGRTTARGLFLISRGQAGREGWARGREIAQAQLHQGQLISLADGDYGQGHGPRPPPLQPSPEQVVLDAPWAALARSRACRSLGFGETFGGGFDARWAALARSRACWSLGFGESFAFAACLAARRSSFLPIIVATIVLTTRTMINQKQQKVSLRQETTLSSIQTKQRLLPRDNTGLHVCDKIECR